MIKFTYVTFVSVVQTMLYGGLLWLAYQFWSAPNAGLVIGTAFIIWLLIFFVAVFVQNVVVLNSKHGRWTLLVVGLPALAPFAMYWDGLTPVLIALTIIVVSLPVSINRRMKLWRSRQGDRA